MEETAWFASLGAGESWVPCGFPKETTIPQKPATDEEDPEFGWTLQSRLPHSTPLLPS